MTIKKSSLMHVKFKCTSVFFEESIRCTLGLNGMIFGGWRGFGQSYATRFIASQGRKLSRKWWGVWEKLLWMFPRRRLSSLCINLQSECMRFSNRRGIVSPQDGIARRAHMLTHAKSAQNEIFRTDFHNYMSLKKWKFFNKSKRGTPLKILKKSLFFGIESCNWN